MRGELGDDGVAAHGQRAPMDGGLDGRVAEPLPARREHDRVTGRVRVGDRPDPPPFGERRCGPAVDGADGCLGQEAGELGPVALLGRAEDPVGRPEAGGERQRGGHVLAGDGPRGVQQEALVRAHSETGASGGPVTRGRVGVERVRDRGGVDAARRELPPAEVVDGHVGPRAVHRRPACDRGEPLPLPGEVVVVEDGWAPC